MSAAESAYVFSEGDDGGRVVENARPGLSDDDARVVENARPGLWDDDARVVENARQGLWDDDDGRVDVPRPALAAVAGPAERVDPSEAGVSDPTEEGWPVGGLADGLYHDPSCSEVLNEAFDLVTGAAWLEDGRVVNSGPSQPGEELMVLIEDGRLIGGLLMDKEFVGAGAYNDRRVAKFVAVAGRFRGQGRAGYVVVGGKKVYPSLVCGRKGKGGAVLKGSEVVYRNPVNPGPEGWRGV